MAKIITADIYTIKKFMHFVLERLCEVHNTYREQNAKNFWVA